MLYEGNHERQDEINSRSVEFQKPNRPLQPYFSPRPVRTRNTILPLVDTYPMSTVPIQQYMNYSVEQDFYSGDAKPPGNGYLAEVESELHNQYFAIQRSGIQNYYVPSSQSDLYKRREVVGRAEDQSHPLLFSKTPLMGSVVPAVLEEKKIGGDMFHNHTRFQLR